VLITGASGFIGRWLARQSTAQGATLCLVVRDRSTALPILERWGARGEIVQCDLLDPDQIRRLIDSWKPDLVMNAAGYGVDHAERDERPGEHEIGGEASPPRFRARIRNHGW
jgi:short-subunit dehydrogenase